MRAVTEGVLWALDRAAFRGSLHKSTHRALLKTLRGVDFLRFLPYSQLQRLADSAAEACYAEGHVILKEVKRDPEGTLHFVHSPFLEKEKVCKPVCKMVVLAVNLPDEVEYAASCPDLEQIAGAGL